MIIVDSCLTLINIAGSIGIMIAAHLTHSHALMWANIADLTHSGKSGHTCFSWV